jgi:hypothetical protein
MARGTIGVWQTAIASLVTVKAIPVPAGAFDRSDRPPPAADRKISGSLLQDLAKAFRRRSVRVYQPLEGVGSGRMKSRCTTAAGALTWINLVVYQCDT